MYESFYGFSEKPFSLLPDPSFLYMGKKHSLAYAMLQYGLTNRAGFTVITGRIGCGKTTLLRHLLDELDDDVTVGLISNTQQNAGQLLQWVLMAFGLDYRGKSKIQLYQAFHEYLIDEYASNRRTVLIIDEAQNLSAQVLEEFRMLSNINADKDQVLQMILVGQPQLRELLQRPELEQFAQRIAADYHLTELNREETAEYIHFRTRTAGVERPMFDQAATDLIHRYARGVPRLINTLCDTALVYGFAEQAQQVSAEIVQMVARDKAETGLLRLDFSHDESALARVPKSAAENEQPLRDNLIELDKDQARQLFKKLSSD